MAAPAKDLDAPRVTSKFQEHFATSSEVWKAEGKNPLRPSEEFTLNLNSGSFALQYNYRKAKSE